MAINPYGIDPMMLGDQWNTGFLQNQGKPTFMQPSSGVPYRTPQQGPETKLPQPTLSDVYAKTHFIPSPQEGFDNFYSITGAPGSQPGVQSKSPPSSNSMTDILSALAQSLTKINATTTSTAQTSGPIMGSVQTSSPSVTTTTNPNIGLK